MAAGDQVTVSFQADDTTAIKDAAFDTLAPGATDKVIVYQSNNYVYVTKIATA